MQEGVAHEVITERGWLVEVEDDEDDERGSLAVVSNEIPELLLLVDCCVVITCRSEFPDGAFNLNDGGIKNCKLLAFANGGQSLFKRSDEGTSE